MATFPGIVKEVTLTAQTASVGPTLLYAVPVNAAGMYRIILDLIATTVAPPPSQISATAEWNNGTGANNTFTTAPMFFTILGLENVPNSITFYSAGGQNINYSTTLTFAGQYSLRIKLEYMGA